MQLQLSGEMTMVALTSFAKPMNAVVIGASGGIGKAITEALIDHERVGQVLACSRSIPAQDQRQCPHQVIDLEDETSIASAAERARDLVGDLDLILIATGILHDGKTQQPEKTWRSLEPEQLALNFRINAIGPALVAKHFLPLLAKNRKSMLAALSARVGSITDNGLGGWYSYRASKAALNMLLRNFAIELKRRNAGALCVGLHPGTVATDLSEPFRANVPEGKLFSPDIAATHLLTVIDDLGPEDSGNLFAWDGQPIPF